MTVGEWLATRTPPPPPALLSRIRGLLGDDAEVDAEVAADRCLDAAERAVEGLLRSGRTGRESAADLLAADALVTYAFEAATARPHDLLVRARSAMGRLARLGSPESNASGRTDPSLA
jgi:hypothetical protein